MFYILTSSPETNGLTATTAGVLREVFTAHGKKVEIIDLNKIDFVRCTACGKRGWGACREKAICAHDKAFNDLQEKLESSEGFAVVSPVYFHEPSEICKLVLDKIRRCQSFKSGSSFVGKRVVFCACAGGSGNGTENCLGIFRKFSEFTRVNAVYFGINHQNKVDKFAELSTIIM